MDAREPAGDAAPARIPWRAVDVLVVWRTLVRLETPDRTLELMVDRLGSRSERCRRCATVEEFFVSGPGFRRVRDAEVEGGMVAVVGDGEKLCCFASFAVPSRVAPLFRDIIFKVL